MITEIKTNTGIKLCDSLTSLINAFDKKVYKGLGINNIDGPYNNCEEYIAFYIGTRFLSRPIKSEDDIIELEKIANNYGFENLELLIAFILAHSILLDVRSCLNCGKYVFNAIPEHVMPSQGCFGGICMYMCTPTSEFDSFIDCPSWESKI